MREAPEENKARNRVFLARWKGRLLGPAMGPEYRWYHESWATDGNGSKIDLLGIPVAWYDRLDAILREVEQRYPEFRIMQCKLKFGTARMRLANVPLEINGWISEQLAAL